MCLLEGFLIQLTRFPYAWEQGMRLCMYFNTYMAFIDCIYVCNVQVCMYTRSPQIRTTMVKYPFRISGFSEFQVPFKFK